MTFTLQSKRHLIHVADGDVTILTNAWKPDNWGTRYVNYEIRDNRRTDGADI